MGWIIKSIWLHLLSQFLLISSFLRLFLYFFAELQFIRLKLLISIGKQIYLSYVLLQLFSLKVDESVFLGQLELELYDEGLKLFYPIG